jgi:hypothetical protein
MSGAALISGSTARTYGWVRPISDSQKIRDPHFYVIVIIALWSATSTQTLNKYGY